MFQTGAKVYLKEKKIGVRCTLTIVSCYGNVTASSISGKYLLKRNVSKAQWRHSVEQPSMRRKASRVPWAIQTCAQTSTPRQGIREKEHLHR